MAFPPAQRGEGTNAFSLLSDAIDFPMTLSNLNSLPEALPSNTVTLWVEASTCEARAGSVLQTVEGRVLAQHARSPRLDAHHQVTVPSTTQAGHSVCNLGPAEAEVRGLDTQGHLQL